MKKKGTTIMKIGFIGCGNMGSALVKAVAECVCEKELLLCDHHEERTKALATLCDGSFCGLETVASESDILFLGVKPQVLDTLAYELCPLLEARADAPVLVSMAAGVSLWSLGRMFPDGAKLVRIMPNLPVSIGAGVILYCAEETVSEKELSTVLALLEKAGSLVPVPESKFDAATSVSGCGPAFAAMFAEALADGAVQCGLPRKTALTLAAETLKGTSEMLLQTETHPDALKDAVCSPGGTTIEGVLALENGGFRAAAANAVIAAFKKTLALQE